VSRKHLLLLAAAVTDATFERTRVDGQAAWVGKCLHCGRKLVVRDDGRAMGQATLEHVWPQSQGGSDEVANLAVACSGCNREKGTRHDHGKSHGQGRGKTASRLDDVARVLRERRRERWRDPASVGMAARLAPVMADPDVPSTE
jgi:5-methylcytosine-specific restriction endonuclease McrA